MEDRSKNVRALSRASRHIDRAAQALIAADVPDGQELVAALATVLDAVKCAHAKIVAADPDLDYYDDTVSDDTASNDQARAATPYMQQLLALQEVGAAACAQGDRLFAAALLTEALTLDPPPIVYERIEKRRDEILASAR